MGIAEAQACRRQEAVDYQRLGFDVTSL